MRLAGPSAMGVNCDPLGIFPMPITPLSLAPGPGNHLPFDGAIQISRDTWKLRKHQMAFNFSVIALVGSAKEICDFSKGASISHMINPDSSTNHSHEGDLIITRKEKACCCKLTTTIINSSALIKSRRCSKNLQQSIPI